ncbi:MAG: phenylacetate--CoA ligase family protein [Nitrospiraceae bacterium]
MPDERYWNRQLETMDPEQLQDLQNARLREQTAWVYERSSFYRERMDSARVKPGDIRTVQDLSRLPIMQKLDYRREQDAYPPYGRLICVPQETLVKYWTTSGSTGKPTVFATTLEDYEDYLESAARVLWTAGVRPGWKVAVPFSHGHWIGLWGVFDATWLKVKAQILPLGGYDSEYRIRKMAEVGIDAFCATPTYASHLSEVARRLGIHVKSIGVKTVLTAGEPASPATRRMIEETWGATTFDFYGNTENLSYMGVDCEEKAGFHFWQDRTVVEVVDSDGQPVPDGQEGEVVFTNLTARSMPAIRLRIGDVTRIDRSACKCGRTHLRVLYILGRREDVVKVRGVNIYPRVMDDVIRGMAGVGSEYRLVFRRDQGLDAMVVQVEPLPQVDSLQISEALRTRIRHVCGVTPIVETLVLGTLPKSEVKAKRVFDERGVDEFKRS